MTGIERLRKEATRWSALYDIESHGLLKIADQIEREMLMRPCFEDGEPAQWGDEYECKGEVGKVHHIDYTEYGWQVWSSGHPIVSSADGLKRPEPDSWEKLTADIERCGDSCAYFGRNCYDGGSACKGCPCHGADDACMVLVMRDVLGRAKKLAGVE